MSSEPAQREFTQASDGSGNVPQLSDSCVFPICLHQDPTGNGNAMPALLTSAAVPW